MRTIFGALSLKNQKGVSLVEQILVVIIISISAGVALVSMQRGAENREAKQVISALKQIGQLVRVYQLNSGEYPDNPDLSDLEDKGYLNRAEFPHRNKYNYIFIPGVGNETRWAVQSTNVGGTRTLTVQNNNNNSQFDVTDSLGLYTDT